MLYMEDIREVLILKIHQISKWIQIGKKIKERVKPVACKLKPVTAPSCACQNKAIFTMRTTALDVV